MSTNSTIWMGDIEPKMTEQDIMNCFLKFNIHPQNVKLIKDKKTNENKNYCFIYFKTIKEANAVLFKLNKKKIPGSSLVFRLNWANNRSIFNKSAYVGNLNPKVDDLKLYNLFKKKYPSVHHASVITENGVSKGYGFVLFNGKEEYEMSLKEMNGISFYGNIIKVKEQKKKNEKSHKDDNNNIDNEDDSISSSISDSEKDKDTQMQLRKNNCYGNNINSINNINNDTDSILQSVPLRIINNNQIYNNLISIDNNINNIANSKINNIGINNIKNIPLSNINNFNINNNLLFNYNIVAPEKFLYSPINKNINNDTGNIVPKKSNFSNNSIVSLNSFNSEQMSNYSTAEKLSTQIKPKKDILEILNPIDDNTLIKKIQESIKKIYNYYQANPFHGDRKINCKFYIYFII